MRPCRGLPAATLGAHRARLELGSPGLDLVTRWHWKTEMVTRYAEHLFKSFGANRVMAASNWPVSLMGGTYTEIWSGITELANMLSPAERAQVMGGTAERIYGL